MKITRRRFLGVAAASIAAGYACRSNVAEVVDVQAAICGLRATIRVLFFADMHMPWCFVSESTLQSAVEHFQPDLILIGGDSIDKPGNEKLVSRFGPLTARYGKFAILGNWEYWGGCNIPLLRDEYARAGVKLLVNESVDVGYAERGTLRLVGLDDLLGGAPRPSLVGPKDSSILVLAHCPELFDQLPPIPLLCLSGHTHGGQIAPLGLVLYVPPGSGRYVHGPYQVGDQRHLYVTRGLGNSVVPLRIGSRPEVVQLTLVPGGA